MSSTGSDVNVSRLVDDGKVTAFQVMVIVLCSAVAFLDGLDTQSIALAGPLIGDAFGIPHTAMGAVFSAQTLGTMSGALCFGSLGDRFGRKRILVLSTAMFGVFTLATAFTASFSELLAIRFLAGIGLGGATPCFIALATEYAPRRRRVMTASLIWAAFPLGGSLGGFVNGALLTSHGWQAVFLFGGLLPLLGSVVLAVMLPESLRFLLSRGAPHARIAAIVHRIRPGLDPAARFTTDELAAHRATLVRLFTDDRARTTLLLWVPFFTAFGVLGIAVIWTPLLMRANGLAPGLAGTALGVHGMGALIGMAGAGRLMERFGAVPVLVPALLLGAVATGALGYAAASLWSVSAVLFLVGAFVGLGASGSIALAASFYPTSIRSSGVGAAMATGRLSQMLAPLLASHATTMSWSGEQLFVAFGLAPALAAIAVLKLRPIAPLA